MPEIHLLQLYDVLSDPSVNAKDIYQTLSPDLQSDLWMLQLEEFFARDPRLTAEQREVALQMIGLLASGIVQQNAAGNTDYVDTALASIEQRGRTAYTRSERIVFGELGRPAIELAAAALQIEREPKRLLATDGARSFDRRVIANGDCDCNADHDFCAPLPTSPSNVCQRAPNLCTRTTCCCGWAWLQACNGRCANPF